LRCSVRTPPRKIRARFQGYKHTSFNAAQDLLYEAATPLPSTLLDRSTLSASGLCKTD
jgi:hypothetical protein